MDARQALRRVRAAFPTLGVRGLRRLGAGWANSCWLSEGGIVFRFAETAAARAGLRKEAALMPVLAPLLPLAAPDFRYAAPEAGLGGYPLVPGTPLGSLASADAPEVGTLLTALHTFPVPRAAALGVPGGGPEAWRARLADFLATVESTLAPRWAEADAAAARRHIARFVEDDRNFAFTPALVHADLVPEHLLADPVTTRLTGVIDFEDAQIGDPAIDFAGLGPEVWMACANYRGPADPGYRHRAAFYHSLAPLHRMIYGAESGRHTHIRTGLADWRRSR